MLALGFLANRSASNTALVTEVDTFESVRRPIHLAHVTHQLHAIFPLVVKVMCTETPCGVSQKSYALSPIRNVRMGRPSLAT